MARGRLPNFARLAAARIVRAARHVRFRRRARWPGPPSSPASTRAATASSTSFIAIPKTMVPFLSTTRTGSGRPDDRSSASGSFRSRAARVELLRQGQPFWEVLEDRGVETTIVRMPANFPPSGTATRELSGMGTPDILGTYGTFSFFTSEPYAFGGTNAFRRHGLSRRRRRRRRPRRRSRVPTIRSSSSRRRCAPSSSAYVDASRQFVKLVVGSEERLLRVGEWSDWVPVELELMPSQTLPRRGALLSEAARPVLRAVREPAEPRPVRRRRCRSRRPTATPPSWRAPPAASTRRACPKTRRASRPAS